MSLYLSLVGFARCPTDVRWKGRSYGTGLVLRNVLTAVDLCNRESIRVPVKHSRLLSLYEGWMHERTCIPLHIAPGLLLSVADVDKHATEVPIG
jgi:hypothetical protein